MTMQKITITSPDDWHLHLRDGIDMASVINASARCFKRAIIMPNLKIPVKTVVQALTYREQILANLPKNNNFQPLMTLYLTDNTSVADIELLYKTQNIVAVKYYPAGATTNSNFGVSDIKKVEHVLEALENYQIPLLIHGEVTHQTTDIFDREQQFIYEILEPLLNKFTRLKVVFEHITTTKACDYIIKGENRLAATVTAHHLLMNRNAIFRGGINPHHYCLPILKREENRLSLIEAVTSGNSRFFLGTDSAPHAQNNKEKTCGCAGIYTAPAAIELYTEVFSKANALNKLEGFASFHGADFYNLPRNTDKITLIKKSWQMSASFTFGNEKVIPLRAGEEIKWQISSY
jgi:dihydroorotase